jgi:peroxiredoxin
VKPFVAQRRLPFPVYVIRERSPSAVSRALGLDWTGAVPATFLFDAKGRLIKSWFEEVSLEDLNAAVAALHS